MGRVDCYWLENIEEYDTFKQESNTEEEGFELRINYI